MVELTTIEEAKAFAEELKKSLEGSDKNVTVNINLNVAEQTKKSEPRTVLPRGNINRIGKRNRLSMCNNRTRVDKETGKSISTTKLGVPPRDNCACTASSKDNKGDTVNVYTTTSNWKDVTHKCMRNRADSSNKLCDCDDNHMYRPDVNRRNACRRREARRFEKRREELLRNGLADCKISQCESKKPRGPKSYHKKFVDDAGNVITVNYMYNDNPTQDEIELLTRKMNNMLQEFTFFW